MNSFSFILATVVMISAILEALKHNRLVNRYLSFGDYKGAFIEASWFLISVFIAALSFYLSWRDVIFGIRGCG